MGLGPAAVNWSDTNPSTAAKWLEKRLMTGAEETEEAGVWKGKQKYDRK